MKISNLKEEFGEKTIYFLLLNLVTGGSYSYIWLIERYKIFNELFGKNVVSRKKILYLASLWGMYGLLHTFSLISKGGFSYMFSLVGLLICICWIVEMMMLGLKLGKELDIYYVKTFKVDLRINKFYLITFNLFYINYCINELDEIERKHNYLT